MRELNLTRKTGFEIPNVNAVVIVRDFRGKMFYNTEPILGKVKQFNLPKGKYFIDSGSIKELPAPVNYPLFKLPTFERYGYPDPKTFAVEVGDNPNKCSVLWDIKTILMDKSLLEYSLPELDFIRFHEYSHRHYKTEKKADLMAVNYMLYKGYNPSQIGFSLIYSLSDNAYTRKENIVKKIAHYETRKKL